MNEETKKPVITELGHHLDISEDDYHKNPNLLAEPSLSASGAKAIVEKSPLHFWHSSCLNPNREEKDESHFAIGKACHYLMLMGDDWAKKYHVLPEGFRSNATQKFKIAIAAAEAAEKAGLTIMKFQEAKAVRDLAASVNLHAAAANAMKNGVPESTLVWRDPETGVLLRCRPDFLPRSAMEGGDVRAITDLKFMAPSNCSPSGFSKSIASFGYHIAAAFYFEGIKQVFGQEPTHWLHLAVEKEAPYSVSTYPLPASDIERGRFQMRKAVRKFADCLEKDEWPGYVTEPTEVGLPAWARKAIDDHGTMNQAALINSAED